MYQRGAQKILKALDYIEPSLKSLQYTYSKQKKSIWKQSTFIKQTYNNIQNSQNAIAILYEQLNAIKQLLEKSLIQFNAYLATIERNLPQQDETTSAMTFYSKLTKELKKQFKTSDIPILETRAKYITIAQHIQEGLHRSDGKRSSKDNTTSSSKYSYYSLN